ncbi:TetR/AcrR family transcriptional regulator [Sphingobium herbicidovorans]|jgi:TetR/AcrR family transcriptional regulator, mexJK operon transcriptional repressor|uniref:TetR/AcrR family transcriptional regulator n=1 Tax=Sphingobium herbicidovorans TaxID=76947 RepID=UPI000788AF0A|nr:TetR/AcrR family transcriptional regulator [Sphingobium herbicidovorans]
MSATKTENAFTPKRGRPNAKQVAAIDQAILSTATRMFLESGYDAVAMENIATATGVSKGTLYARYPSKEALFMKVIKARVDGWAIISSHEDHLLTDDIGERLRHHARTIARSLLQTEVRAFGRLTLAHRERFPELAKALYESGYLYIVQLIKRDMEEAGTRDGMPPRDADGAARMLVSALAGWEMQESGAGPISESEMLKAADRAVDLFMAARSSW